MAVYATSIIWGVRGAKPPDKNTSFIDKSTHGHVLICISIHIYIYPHIHTYTETYIHLYIHTHVCLHDETHANIEQGDIGGNDHEGNVSKHTPGITVVRESNSAVLAMEEV